MTQILRHKKILLIIALNLVTALLIALIAEWLFYKNSHQSFPGIVNQTSKSLEDYKMFFLSLFKVYPIIVLLLLSLSFVLIKTTKPILEDLLFNEKDLVKAQNNAKKNEKALLTLMKNLPVGLVLYDISGDITQYNDYAINYLGFTRNQYRIKGLIGPSLHLIREDCTDMAINEYPLNNVIANHVILKNKVGGIVGKSGNIVWVKYNAYPVFGYFGSLKQVIVTFTDITDQKEMEIALKDANGKLREQTEELTQLLDNLNETNAKLAESEARYKLISDFSTSWETFRHPDGKLIYCSPAVEEVIGYTKEEYLKGIPFSTFVHPDDLDKFTEHVNNGLTGKIVSSCVVRLIHKNQTLKWVDFALKPVFSEMGELLGTRFSVRDITRLKEAELALHESRELLNLIFQYSSSWETYRDQNGNLIFCSLAMENVMGYQVEEYLSNKIDYKDIIHPDDYEMAMLQFKRALSGETIPSHILRYIHKNKNIVWADLSARPVFSESGEILGIRFSFKDITKLKENELELKELNAKLIESEARYKLISDFSHGWETFRHPDGKIVYCSPSVEQVIGYTREEYINDIPFPSFVHPNDIEKFTEYYKNGLAGNFVPSLVVRLLHKDQTIKWVDSEMRPVVSETGELLGTRFSIWDITRLKETELALHESRELLNLVFQYSNDWESYRDKNGKLIYSSLAMEQLLGYQVSEYLADKIGFKDIIHPDDYETAMSHFERALSGETIPSLLLRYLHKNKNVVWVDVSARPVFSESGEMLGIRFSSKDITKLKEYEMELKELNATKDKFFSVISHDLRSPFTGLLGFSEILYNEYNRSSEETIKNYVSNIYSLSKNTFELLENLLAWSQSQTGKIKLNQKKIHLKPYSDAIIQMINPIAQKKKIILTNSITEDIYAYADENMLHTIFRNLISNAIKYTYESGTIDLRAITEDSVITISVSDTGVGMSDDIKNSLFKISETKSQPGTQSEKGTGLGLILCKEFVEKHGGKIWVESEIGKGTTFFFTIPSISS